MIEKLKKFIKIFYFNIEWFFSNYYFFNYVFHGEIDPGVLSVINRFYSAAWGGQFINK